MKKNILSILILALFIVSCAGYKGGASVVRPDERPEPADSACAYFYFLWGKSAELDQRYEEAYEAYQKVLLCDDGANSVLRELAVLLIKMGRKQEAADRLQQALVNEPADIELRRLLVRLYSSMDQTEAAIQVVLDILAIDKEDSQAMMMLGSLYTNEKKYDQAQQILEKLVKLDPNSYLGYYQLARLRRELRLFDQAAADYEKALEINWSMVLAFEVAEFYEKQQQFDAAIRLYLRILDEDEASELARTRLINAYLIANEPEKALVELKALQETSDDPQRINYTIYRLLVDQERYDEAIQSLGAYLEENPDQHAFRYLLAIAHLRNEKPLEAIRILGSIPASADEFEDSVLTTVRILHEEKQTDKAIEFMQAKLQDDEAVKVSFFVVLASLYLEQKKNEEAKAVFEDALVRYPEEVEIFYEYGMFYERIGRQDEAIAKMQRVLDLQPENSAALNYVGYTWADMGVNLEKALEYIEKAVELKPDDGYIRDSLGWVYFKLGDLQRAVAELEKATALATEDPVVHEHMGDVYLKADQPQKALEAYKKSFKFYAEDEKKEQVNIKIKRLMK